MARNDRLYGDESTRDTIFANSSGANPILDVQSNFNPAANLEQTAVIENMVIDGKNNPVAGIRLRDVYNCWVRNVTIKDCDVGIIIDSTAGHSSNQNRFEHIRMMNVRQGFQFTGADNGTTHAYTTIDDVAISLKNEATAVGIQLGNMGAQRLTNLTNAFIKANVWLTHGSSDCTGMFIYGKVKYSIINFEVERSSTGGTGIQIRTPGSNNVVNNQGFALTALGTGNPLYVNPAQAHDIEQL